jgi:hypothetical protein
MGDGDELSADKTVPWDVGGLPVDVGTVDRLARLQLAMLRQGRRLVLHGAGRDLVELLTWAGLGDLLPAEPESPSRTHVTPP